MRVYLGRIDSLFQVYFFSFPNLLAPIDSPTLSWQPLSRKGTKRLRLKVVLFNFSLLSRLLNKVVGTFFFFFFFVSLLERSSVPNPLFFLLRFLPQFWQKIAKKKKLFKTLPSEALNGIAYCPYQRPLYPLRYSQAFPTRTIFSQHGDFSLGSRCLSPFHQLKGC